MPCGKQYGPPKFGGPHSANKRHLLLASASSNLKVIHDGEHTRHAIRTNAGHVLVSLVIDHAVQRDMAVDHRDPNRLRWIKRVLVQWPKAVNGPRFRQPNAVVHRRYRSDIQLVDYVAYSRRILHQRDRRVFVGGSVHSSAQRHHAVLHTNFDVVERRRAVTNAIVRQALRQLLAQRGVIVHLATAGDLDYVAYRL